MRLLFAFFLLAAPSIAGPCDGLPRVSPDGVVALICSLHQPVALSPDAVSLDPARLTVQVSVQSVDLIAGIRVVIGYTDRYGIARRSVRYLDGAGPIPRNVERSFPLPPDCAVAFIWVEPLMRAASAGFTQ